MAGPQLFGPLDGSLGLFTGERLGFKLAWLAAIYLTFQLISIPFALPARLGRFLGVFDGVASLVPLTVALVADDPDGALERGGHERPYRSAFKRSIR